MIVLDVPIGLDYYWAIIKRIVLVVFSYRLALGEGQSLGIVHGSIGSNNSILISTCLIILKGLANELLHQQLSESWSVWITSHCNVTCSSSVAITTSSPSKHIKEITPFPVPQYNQTILFPH